MNELIELIGCSINVVCLEDILNANDFDGKWGFIIQALTISWKRLTREVENINFSKVLQELRNFLNENTSRFDENEKVLIDEDLKIWESNWETYVRKSRSGSRTLGDFVRAVSLGNTQKSNDTGVILTTVHMSKGLEYDVVFVMGLNEGVFPDYRSIQSKSQLVEENHNIFVAITRSKRLCYLTYPRIKQTPWGIKHQKPSRYIKELNDN